MILPFFWLFSASLMTPQELIAFPPKFIPAEPQWQNYIEVTKKVPFLMYYKNSFIVATSYNDVPCIYFPYPCLLPHEDIWMAK